MISGHVRTGLVYSLQRYCIHDGPGIRTDIFFKGCALRCPWCCNPESQKPYPELAFQAGKCYSCGMCYKKCEEGALRKEGDFRVDSEKCTLCGACVRYCGRDCYKIYGRTYTAQELLHEVVKDDIFYQNSGGGVTVTGGEPMMQYEFVLEFLALCKDAGIDTAMETHGFCPADHYRAVAPYVDHFLMDLKHMDPEKCHAVTGAPRSFSPMENMKLLAEEYSKKISIRIPVIPGFNNDLEHFARVAQFALELKGSGGLRMIHLLPYHIMGSSKYETLHLPYHMKGVPALADSEVELLRDYFCQQALPCVIGG